MFEAARAELNKRGYDVLGGYLSPVNDAYKKPGLAPARDRVAMARAAASSSTWIMVDSWEAEQPHYQRTLAVLRNVESRLHQALDVQRGDSQAPRVMLLCGADMLESFATPGVWLEDQLREIFEGHGVVVVTRPGGNLPALLSQEGTVLARHRDHITVVNDVVHSPLSSTVVRQSVQQGLPLKYLVTDDVAVIIDERHLYKDLGM